MTQSGIDAAADLDEGIRTKFYIEGQWVAPTSDRIVELTSPVDEHAWMTAPLAAAADIDRAVAAARQTFDQGPWRSMPPSERAATLRRFAAEIERYEPLFARLWTAEVGAPISFTRMFVPTARAMLGYYAGLLESYVFEEIRQTPNGEARIIREPVGLAVLVTPWNAALPVLFYKLAAALAAGCTVVIKSSPETPFDALLVARCAHAAGIPAGVVNVITADREGGAYLVASPAVDKVSFTGSTAAGRQVGKSCLDRMARFTMELGGKSAAIFLDDVDLSRAIPEIAPLTIPFSGQICFAQTRIIAPRSRADELVAAYSAAISALTVGDPWDPGTFVGPVASEVQMKRALYYMEGAKADGAICVLGGSRAEGFDRGYFIAPTIFTNVTPDMEIAREEVFGPVVVVQTYDTEEEAIALANHSDFGLSGSVLTGDPDRGLAVARRIRTGNIGVNTFEVAPNVPFGGYKQSGIGREGGPEGLEAFLETKAIYKPAAA